MGTVNNNMAKLYRNCIDAFRDSSCQVILSVGNLVDIQEFADLPENIGVFSQVDQIAVLQHADVFVTHCGMNSVSEGLYFGVPLVMLPQTSEQHGVAARVLQMEAGVELKKTAPEDIREAVEQVLEDARYKKNAQMIGDGFHSCAGAKGAADKILSVCR